MIEKKRTKIQNLISYREFPVPAVLTRHVRCMWHLRLPANSETFDTVYPDGHCELIIHMANPMKQLHGDNNWKPQSRCIFAGQQRTAICLSATEHVDCLGVRLQPAASAAFNKLALADWRDKIINFDEIDRTFVSRFSDAALAFVNDPLNEQLWLLLSECLGPYSIDDRIEKAVKMLIEEEGRLAIHSIVEITQMSPRSFQNRFLRQVGLGAKEFARILRLQATIRSLGSTVDSLADHAIESGFSDQAHANREVRRITGLTPASLQRALTQDHGGAETIRMAAAFVRGGKF